MDKVLRHELSTALNTHQLCHIMYIYLQKKDKKKKKDTKKHKHKKSSHAVDQLVYGSHGVLRDSDFFNKQPEFECWMREVKNLPDFNGPKWEVMEHFKSFAEDYNTCTFPSSKFYNLAKWEAEEVGDHVYIYSFTYYIIILSTH